jgi:hypothetical protein
MGNHHWPQAVSPACEDSEEVEETRTNNPLKFLDVSRSQS